MAPDVLQALLANSEDLELVASWVRRESFRPALENAEAKVAASCPEAFNYFGEANLRRRYFQYALECWEQCRKLGPHERLERVWALYELARLDEAVQLAEQIKETIPADCLYLWYFLFGMLALRRNEEETARASFHIACQSAPHGSMGRQRGLTWLSKYMRAAAGEPVVDGAALANRWRYPIDRSRSQPLIVLGDSRSPDFNATSPYLNDFLDTAVALRLLLEVGNIGQSTFGADELIAEAPSAGLGAPTFDLAVIDRHQLWSGPVLRSTRSAWMIWHGDASRKTFGAASLGASPSNLNLLFLGFSISDPRDLTDKLIEWLRPFAPIGCDDLRTTEWLLNQGVPSFWSGRLHEDYAKTVVCQPASHQNAEPSVRTLPFQELVRRADAQLISDYRMSRSAQIVRKIYRAIGEGLGVDGVRAIWHDLVIPLVENCRARLEAQRGILRRPKQAIGKVAKATKSPPVVTLAVCFDQNLAPFTAPLLRSVLQNTAADVRVVALVRGLNADQAQRALSTDAETRVISMDALLEDTNLRFGLGKTISMMDRILLPDVLPDEDRIVYLDIDVIVQGDIAELASIEPSPRGIAARPTPSVNFSTMLLTIERRARELPKEQADAFRRVAAAATDLMAPYFNSGVLVLSLDRMRKRHFVGKALRLMKDVGLRDQDILNLYSGGEFVRLPRAWNAVPYSELSGDAKLIHWAGHKKPWMSGNVLLADRWRAFVPSSRLAAPST